MNKRKVGRKLNREIGPRRALLSGLARNLILHQRIETSEARAKELRPFVEKLVTKARQENLAALRYLKTYINEDAVWKLLKEIAPKYKERPGGYTRVIKIVTRRNDASKRAIIEFV